MTVNRGDFNISDGAALAIVAGLGVAAYLAARKAGSIIHDTATAAADATADAARTIATAPEHTFSRFVNYAPDVQDYFTDAHAGPSSARIFNPNTTTREEIITGGPAWHPQTNTSGPRLKYLPDFPLVPEEWVTRPLVDLYNRRLEDREERDLIAYLRNPPEPGYIGADGRRHYGGR